jgi:hypothetical protein
MARLRPYSEMRRTPSWTRAITRSLRSRRDGVVSPRAPTLFVPTWMSAVSLPRRRCALVVLARWWEERHSRRDRRAMTAPEITMPLQRLDEAPGAQSDAQLAERRHRLPHPQPVLLVQAGRERQRSRPHLLGRRSDRLRGLQRVAPPHSPPAAPASAPTSPSPLSPSAGRAVDPPGTAPIPRPPHPALRRRCLGMGRCRCRPCCSPRRRPGGRPLPLP